MIEVKRRITEDKEMKEKKLYTNNMFKEAEVLHDRIP